MGVREKKYFKLLVKLLLYTRLQIFTVSFIGHRTNPPYSLLLWSRIWTTLWGTQTNASLRRVHGLGILYLHDSEIMLLSFSISALQSSTIKTSHFQPSMFHLILNAKIFAFYLSN